MSSDLLKGGNLLTVAAIGLGASVLGPIVAPVLRPMAKSLIKGGLIAYDQGRAALAELGERTSDMIAEARDEMSRVEPQAAAAAGAGGGRKAVKPEARPH
jgi:hypothetical protein